MRTDDWQLTCETEDFLDRAGDFLRSRPALHTMQLYGVEKLRTSGADAPGAEATLFGTLESEGEVRAAFYTTARGHLWLTPLSADRSATLAAHLAGLGHSPAGVLADRDTAAAFAGAWQRHTGAAAPVPFWRTHLYRLGTLRPPHPRPDGRGRTADGSDRAQVTGWCREFCVEVGEQRSIDLIDAGSWAESRFGDRHFTFWETPDGTPAAMAAATTAVGGMVRVDPVYTPARLRGRGFAGAVTAEVSRAALDAGATDVVLFTDPRNPTSNALYQRLGYERIADFTGYDFPGAASGSGSGA
ncbi:GNAT family N-acetyltransferase [Streptomyces sp. NPDC005573]|uniref:GNAT family N-acetyltransferase n=1 Tax=Streptomyces sp. NPDC005573 TaxID=3156890 RepID=UPI0033A70329